MGAFKQSRLHQALKPHTKREWYLYIHIVLIRYLMYVCLERQAKFCPFAIAKEREKNRKNAKWIFMIWIKCWRHWYYISFGGASGKLNIAKNMIDLVSNRNDAQYMIYHIPYTSSNGLYCRDSFFFSLLLLLLFTSSSGFDHLKGPKSKRILQVLLICFFYFLDPYRRRSMWNVIHWINGRMHDSTWHRNHVTNKRFGLLFLASILFLSI